MLSHQPGLALTGLEMPLSCHQVVGLVVSLTTWWLDDWMLLMVMVMVMVMVMMTMMMMMIRC